MHLPCPKRISLSLSILYTFLSSFSWKVEGNLPIFCLFLFFFFPPTDWEALTESGENRLDWSVAYRPRNDLSLSLPLWWFLLPKIFLFFFSPLFSQWYLRWAFLDQSLEWRKENINLQMRKRGAAKQLSRAGKKIKKKKSTSSLGSREKKREEDEWPGLW